MAINRFEALRTFAQVVNSGSHTLTAAVLFLRKATISQQIRQLAGRLGVRLLNRAT